MAGNTATSDDLLNLRGIRRRIDSFRFDLLDSSNSVIDQIQPDRGMVPVLTNDTTRAVFRTLQGFTLSASEQSTLETISARVRPSLVLQNGSVWPMGVLLFGDATRPRRSWGLELSGSLMDQLYILNQQVGRVVAYDVGTNPVVAAQLLAQEVITSPMSITPTTVLTGTQMAWKPTDTRTKIINDLMTIAGYFPVYFNNNGSMVLRPVTLLPVTTPDYIYEAGGRIVKDSIVESDDLLTAPNRYVVIETGASSSAITATYDLPGSAPNSITNRGFPVVKTLQLQGLVDNAAAAAAAQAAANSDDQTFRQTTFDSTIEPRHDTFNVIQLLGVQYREMSWSARLQAGGRMSHSLRRVYA